MGRKEKEGSNRCDCLLQTIESYRDRGKSDRERVIEGETKMGEGRKIKERRRQRRDRKAEKRGIKERKGK